MSAGTSEGGLQAPTRNKIPWKTEDFYNEESIFKELERVFDICHGCRRCFNLCDSFPILFDLVDESDTFEIDGVDKKDYWNVINNCYLCDMCFMTKCPYVPPHEWNLDFPALMLRAKALKFKEKGASFRDKLMSDPDFLGKTNSLPVISTLFNTSNKIGPVRSIIEGVIGISKSAPLPEYTSKPLTKRFSQSSNITNPNGKVVLFATCYGNYNRPDIGEDLIKVFEHNNIEVTYPKNEKCCGMPKLELGDIKGVEQAKNDNIDILLSHINNGYDVVVPMPSCTFMIKEYWTLLFSDDERVKKVAENTYDPFEYLMKLNKEKKLDTEFKKSLGTIAYHVSCHLRAQNIGTKTKELLSLVPETKIQVIERCSGHDGVYAMKKEFYNTAMKICKPVINKVNEIKADYYTSDCAMAASLIEQGVEGDKSPIHPLRLLRIAYDI